MEDENPLENIDEASALDSEQESKEHEAKEKKARADEILRIARERFDLAVEAESHIRADALDDLKFSAGEQWPDEIKQARHQDARPCLTINRLPQSIHQITNDQRQNRPSIKVSPVDDKADIDTAKILQGLVRHIEYSSNADTAYDTAFDSAVRVGFGYFRICTEYADSFGFEQEIKIKRIRNRFSVYLDPSYQEPDGSDANWGFVFEDIDKDTYKAQYPKSEAASMEEWTAVGSARSPWMSAKSCRVAEYFCREYKEADLLLLNTGDVIEASELEVAMQLDPQVQIVDQRTSVVPFIKWYKINAVEVLEETLWPGKWLPIIPVLGEEYDIDGKRILEGVVRQAKDPQRMYNYWASAETETIALAPRAPWVGAAGQFEGYEAQWKTANVRNHAFLEYNPLSHNGTPVGPPQRNVFEPPVQAISNARMMAAEDLKATTGIYDAALGARSNEKSGVAIQRRSLQAQTSNFHFMDNLSKSIRHAGRVCIDLIPKVYDTARAVRILAEDGQEEIVRINEVFKHKGKLVTYNLGAGKYDVTVNTGPTFETKRQEAVQSMIDLTRAYPQAAQLAADIMVKNMDWPGAQEIAERLRKALPPGIAEEKDKKPIPPEIQAQMGQMGQMIEQLTEQLKHKTEQINTKALELESKERIEMAKIQAEIEMKLADIGSKEAISLLAHEVSEIQSRLQLLSYDQPIDSNETPHAGPQRVLPEGNEQQPTGGFSPGSPMGV